MKRKPTGARRQAAFAARFAAELRRRHGPDDSGRCVYLLPRGELPSLANAPNELAARGVRCAVCGKPALPDDRLIFNLDGAP